MSPAARTPLKSSPSVHAAPPQEGVQRTVWELHMLSRLRRYLQRQLREREAELLSLVADSPSVREHAYPAKHVQFAHSAACPAIACSAAVCLVKTRMCDVRVLQVDSMLSRLASLHIAIRTLTADIKKVRKAHLRSVDNQYR